LARQAIIEDPTSWRAHLQLARSLAGSRRPVEAEASANRALALDPNNPMIWLVLGNIHLLERDYSATAHDFEAYLKIAPIGPQSEQVRKTLDQIHQMLVR
jgi:Flp pilus assembly protein TadD